ncbi:unnamed protein product [Diabrotica balteata]|uniref:Uncharacterized protein n=1 Tax=Diabrotica balteata TaxID=107213 RepID=A0A9N9SSR2_DIABA|nr:unnamed protein product [Diabrotica balteata]
MSTKNCSYILANTIRNEDLLHLTEQKRVQNEIKTRKWGWIGHTLRKNSSSIAKTALQPEKLTKYNCSGTIADFAVAMLCNLDKPVISYQNAASWGYFNCRTSEWNTELLTNASFPVELLPEVRASGEIAGLLAGNWHSVPKGTPIGKFVNEHNIGLPKITSEKLFHDL